MTATKQIIEFIDNEKARSAWRRGVKSYAIDMAERIGEEVSDWDAVTRDELEELALDGARDWSEASWGGCAFVYDEDIARALCTPSELKRTDYGRKRPNGSEEWLDVQARALFQAFLMVARAWKFR